MIPRFPSKTRCYLFSLAVDYPSLKLTVSQEWVSFLPLTLEGFRYRLPFGDFAISFRCKLLFVSGGDSSFPVWSSHVCAKHLGLACRPKAFCAATLKSCGGDTRWMDLVVWNPAKPLPVEVGSWNAIIYKGFHKLASDAMGFLPSTVFDIQNVGRLAKIRLFWKIML